MPLPDRKTIKSDLVTLLRDRGTVSPSEAYLALADIWKLTGKERKRTRGGRTLYEHEIRWARQELVFAGVIRNETRNAWSLAGAAEGRYAIDDALTRLIDGFLDSDSWFMIDWLPRYQSRVASIELSITSGAIEKAVDAIWKERDNDVSNAGQGALASRHIDAARHLFRRITLEILRDPSPEMFDAAVAELDQARAAGQLPKLPRLLVARAFAAIAPGRYHTTVDSEKHEKVIAWFEKHTTFRATPGNWAHRASEVTAFLAGIREFNGAIFVRNMFPWFVYTQLAKRKGRPVFTPGHKSRLQWTQARAQVATRAIELKHNALVDELHRVLMEEHGRDAVGTEQPSGLGGFVDAILKLDEHQYWIYEVKVTKTASDAIRQALGQLLEYAYRVGAWEPQRMFIVAEPPLDTDTREFLSRLRSEFRLPIEYRQLTLSNTPNGD
jgi:hypothetical protein